MANDTGTAAATHDCIECHGAGEFNTTIWVNGREVDEGGSCSECDGTGKVSPDCGNCGEPADHGYVEADREWRCETCVEVCEAQAARIEAQGRPAGRAHWSTNEDHESREAL